MMNYFWWGKNNHGARGIHWLSWDKLLVSKEHRGMGFRNLQCFNLVMLRKQGWKLIFDPDAMISRIFKAKYYPNGDFLSSKIGSNPSYSWRSIWNYRILDKQGIRWSIVEGSKICVWEASSRAFEMQYRRDILCGYKHDVV